MSEPFDPYHVWLGIAPKDQPPNHYRILGVDLFEANPNAIENAADRQMAHLRTFQAGKHGALSQKILNEVAAAEICLLNRQKKTAYDQHLRETSPADDALDSGLVAALQQAEAGKATAPPKHRQNLGILIGLGAVVLLALGLTVRLALPRARPAVVVEVAPQSVPQPVVAREQQPATPPAAKGVELPPAPAQPPAQEKVSAAVKPPADTTPIRPTDKAAAVKLAAEAKPGAVSRPAPAAASTPPPQPSPPQPKSAALPMPTAPKQKLPVPDEAAVAQARTAAEALFKTEIDNAKTSADKLALAKRLLAQALNPTSDTTGKYVLMLMAADLAASARDADTAFQAVDQMAEAFAVDRFAMKTGILGGWAKNARTSDARRSLVEQAMRVGDEALDAGNLEAAKELGKLAASKLSLLRDKSLAQQLKAYRQQLAEAGKDSEELQAARAALAKDPHDSQANLVVGQYLCFTKGDWEKGLPRLAQGSDEKLKGLALQELTSPPTESSEQVAMADAWWEIAQSRRRLQMDAIKIHAGQWYRRAEAALAAGLVKTNVAKRLAEVSKLQNQSLLPPPAIAPFAATEAKRIQKQWADHLGVPVEDTNSIGMPLALIPPGEFDMGSTPEQIAWAFAEGKRCQRKPGYFDRVLSEAPPHHVAITKPFYLGTCPVTQAEYEMLMGTNPSGYTGKQVDASAFKPPMSDVEAKYRVDQRKKMVGTDTRRHPVDTVSWVEAMEFCRRLSALPAERAARRVYRLPTEAEWEYACRAGTTTLWSSGDDEASPLEYAWYNKNSGMITHPVGEKKPNAWGLLDMYGNVCQWCADGFIADFYKQSPPSDPVAPNARGNCVLRGADALGAPTNLRSAGRNCDGPVSHHHSHGFRVAVGR